MRLEAFLVDNRADIIERCRVKVAARRAPRPTAAELERGIPLFLDQLVETLRLQAKNPDHDAAATGHGRDLMNSGFTIAQVVHDYGDVCQSVTDLAIERGAPISNEDFRILNGCLDDAIAHAVTEFSRLRELNVASEGTERLAILAHELRNLLAAATLTFSALKSGSVGVTGATGAVLERSLTSLNLVVNRSLAEARLEAGKFHRERIEVHRLLEEIEISATLSAKRKGILFTVAPPTERHLAVEADSQVLSAVVVNLVQNAFKFTRPESHVTLSARGTAERVQIDVADECGGLPPGAAGSTEALFRPFQQGGDDRSGLGLGLTVARRGAEANGGEIHVRDLPGTGCVFTVDLPRVA